MQKFLTWAGPSVSLSLIFKPRIIEKQKNLQTRTTLYSVLLQWQALKLLCQAIKNLDGSLKKKLERGRISR